jgi:hypothetical protein
MVRVLALLAAFVAACVVPGPDDDELGGGDDGKADGSTSHKFTEVNSAHSTATFRAYVSRGLDALATNADVGRLTLQSINTGHVHVDEFADLTCADYLHVIADLPGLGLTPADWGKRGVATKLEAELDGYMWGNRVYVARNLPVKRLAATLVHETNHVINRSEVGYYDDLPTSAFIHEYRAFYMERELDPDEYAGIDLVDYVITNYELDRSKIHAGVLAHPLTPRLLPDAAAWRARNVSGDRDEEAVCQ